MAEKLPHTRASFINPNPPAFHSMLLPAGVYVHPVGQQLDDAYPETTIGAYLLPEKRDLFLMSLLR
jgi:hypothetical protein